MYAKSVTNCIDLLCDQDSKTAKFVPHHPKVGITNPFLLSDNSQITASVTDTGPRPDTITEHNLSLRNVLIVTSD